jgi:TonB family protein
MDIIIVIIFIITLCVWSKWRNENPANPPKLFWTLMLGWVYLLYYWCNKWEEKSKPCNKPQEEINDCPNYSELYDDPKDRWCDESETDRKKLFGIIAILVIIIAGICIMFNSIDTAFGNKKYDTAEEIEIPADTSVHKINPNMLSNFGASTKSQRKKAKTYSDVYKKTYDKVYEETYNEVYEEAYNEYVDEDKVYDVVEDMPIFPGGSSALFEYLNKNIRYPVVAQENDVQGRVVATFVVERDGSIGDVRIVKSVDPSLDKEAQRIVKSMPHWIPAKQNGIAVRCKYTVPVTFRLSGDIVTKSENTRNENYVIKDDIRLMNKLSRDKEKGKYVDDVYI